MATGLGNIWRKWTGKGITDAQQEVNAFNANEAQKARDFEEQMSNTAYQRQAADMIAAGINPALAMAGSSNGASTPGAAAASAGADPTGGLGLSDLLSTLMTPLSIVQGVQGIKQTEANIEKTLEDARLTRQKRLTEEQNTRIYRINADYQDSLNEQTLTNMRADYDNKVADTDVKVATKDKIKTEKEAQEIVNQYLPERQQKELDQIQANIDKMSADERKSKAEALFAEWQNSFVYANGFLPSSNDWLMIGTYVASLFGVSAGDVKGWIEDLIDRLPGKKKQKPRDKGEGGRTSPTGGGIR